MSTSQKPSIRRPLIDVHPGAPLKFYGIRIDRGGVVYATTSPTVHGRTNPNYEVPVGSVEKVGRKWWGRAFDGTIVTWGRQSDAGKWVMRYAEENQRVD